MALKAADLIKVDDDTSALGANLSNKIVALENDLIPLHRRKKEHIPAAFWPLFKNATL